jgi:hypothetical protein
MILHLMIRAQLVAASQTNLLVKIWISSEVRKLRVHAPPLRFWAISGAFGCTRGAHVSPPVIYTRDISRPLSLVC